jgi:hypothetical protein
VMNGENLFGLDRGHEIPFLNALCVATACRATKHQNCR